MGARPSRRIKHSWRSGRGAPVERTIPQLCNSGYEEGQGGLHGWGSTEQGMTPFVDPVLEESAIVRSL
jgi:hypothetical protein